MDSGVGVSTKTTFMCRCGLVVKFKLVHWFRDWLTSPWWTGFWPRLVLRKGVKFSSLSFFLTSLLTSGLDFLLVEKTGFMQWQCLLWKIQLSFRHGHFLAKDWHGNIGKVFHLRSALILDYKFDSHFVASRQFSQIDWSIGLWVDTFYHRDGTDLFRESRHALRWVTAVAGENIAFLMGCGYGARTAVGGSCQSTRS